jgi:hypothetical protein
VCIPMSCGACVYCGPPFIYTALNLVSLNIYIAGVVVLLYYTVTSEEIATFKDRCFDWKD